MTWNVLFAAGRSPLGPWSAREPVVRETILAAAPDILCLQEIDPALLPFARAGLPGYEALIGEATGQSPYPRRIAIIAPFALALWAFLLWRYGFGPWPLWLTLAHVFLFLLGVVAPVGKAWAIRYRGPFELPGEFCPILYRPASARPLADGCLWISHTPLRAGSAFPFLIEPRMIHWARFLVGAREVLVVNAHLGHAPWHYARTAQVVLATIARERPSPDAPVFLLGDFNAVPGAVVVQRMLGVLKLAWEAAETREGPETTFQWNLARGTRPLRLDHVLFGGAGVSALTARVLTPRLGGKTASDHDPVVVDFEVGG